MTQARVHYLNRNGNATCGVNRLMLVDTPKTSDPDKVTCATCLVMLKRRKPRRRYRPKVHRQRPA